MDRWTNYNIFDMTRLPVISGLIKRRLLVNFRADPDIVHEILPNGFRPKLHDGHALVGICLIRLENVRPKGVPAAIGVSSENAAHRIAIEWTAPDGQRHEGVFVARRDTNSRLNAIAGGRVFPGEYHHSRFEVRDQDQTVSINVALPDDTTSIFVSGRQSDIFPSSSCFKSLADASGFFEQGCIGYSVTKSLNRLDGLELRTARWQVAPFEIEEVRSSFFSDESRFPCGSVIFDHCLIMRDIEHEWHAVDDFYIPRGSPALPI
jgi:hypothetical protein